MFNDMPKDGFLYFINKSIINGYCYFLGDLKWMILQVMLLMKRLMEVVSPSAKKHLGKRMHVRSMRLRFVENSLKPFKGLQIRHKISQRGIDP
jgi:hypothetical protein